MSDDAIADLASAVADGEAIDWQTARSRLSTSQDQSVVEELHSLSRLSGSRQSRASVRGAARLSWGLEAVRFLSIASACLGAAGHLVAVAIPGGPQYPVLFGMGIVFALAGLMLDSGRSDRRARALGGAYWSIAASFGAFGLLGFDRIWPGVWFLAVLVSIRPEAFFGAFLWDFAREFPRITRFSRLDTVCRAGLNASMVVAVALFAANVIPAVAPESTLARWAAPAQRMTKYAPLFWNLVFACALPALIAVGVRARRAAGDEGRRARRFLYAIVLTLGPVLLETVGEGLFPRFRNAVEVYRWWLGWVVYPLLISLPLSTAYIVAATDVLEVRVVIQRGLRYLLTRWLILWGAIVPVGILAMNLYLHRDQPLGVTLATRSSQRLLWVSAVCVLLLMLRQRLTSLLDRFLLPGAVDPAAMLAHMTERLKTSRTPLEVTRTLAEAAERGLQADTRSYIRHEDKLIPLDGGVTVPANSVIAALAAGAREPCIVSPHAGSYYRLLPEADRVWIDTERIHVFLPVTGSRADSSLVGMIALKERRNALGYTEDDLRFLRAASASASLACEALTISRDGLTSTVEPEEMAIECANCGRVAVWQSVPCNCGGTWRAAALPLRVSNRFDLVRRLGAGGMGIVYLATDSVLRRELAAKTLTRLSETAASRLIGEAQAMAAFSHQHIAVLYGIERWRDTPILLMEYMTGGTLAERLRTGPLGESDALSLVRQLAVGLEEVHGRGLFHGDIKPSNIGFTRDGVAKFLDFGLAQFVVDLAKDADDNEDDATGTNFIAGTPAYMSPEVRDGAPRGPGMDVWALSVVLLETLIGEPPLRIPKRGSDVRDGVDRALKRIDTRVSSALVDFLHKSLAPEARRYPANAHDLVQALVHLPRSEPS